MVLTFPRKIRKGSVLKSIWYPLPTNGLLSNTGYHLGDVDEGTFGATECHSERAVGMV